MRVFSSATGRLDTFPSASTRAWLLGRAHSGLGRSGERARVKGVIKKLIGNPELGKVPVNFRWQYSGIGVSNHNHSSLWA